MTLQRVPKKPTFVVKTDLGKENKRAQGAESPLEENVPEEVNDYKKVVYCNFTECVFNKKIDGLAHKETTIKNDGWKPLFPEKVWDSVCNRSEVVIQNAKGIGGQRQPACFTPWGPTGHVDLSKMMPEMFSIPDPSNQMDPYEASAFGPSAPSRSVQIGG